MNILKLHLDLDMKYLTNSNVQSAFTQIPTITGSGLAFRHYYIIEFGLGFEF